MFGIGAAIKTAYKIIENNNQLDELEKIAYALESSQKEPFFTTLSGIERFDTLVPLLDAAFSRKAGSSTSHAQRDVLINNYIASINREYTMAKDELRSIPASRAEVAALGLALREVSITLDKEIAILRRRGEETFQQQASRYTAVEIDLGKKLLERHDATQTEIRTRLLQEFSKQLGHIDSLALQNKETLHSELKQSIADVQNETRDLIHDARETLSRQSRESFESARLELRNETATHFKSLTLETRQRLNEIQAQQLAALDRMNHQIQGMANEQTAFIASISKQTRTTRNRVTLIASSALLISLFEFLLHLWKP